MESCIYDWSVGKFFCSTCSVHVCREHVPVHLSNGNREHVLIEIYFNSQKIKKIVENLSAKIRLIDECEKRIICETKPLVISIQKLRTEALNIIKDKKQIYQSLLKATKEKISCKKVKEIKTQLRKSLVIYVPNHKLKAIEEFYISDFVKELEDCSELFPASKKNLSRIMQDYVKLQNAHAYSFKALAITTDNKYIITGLSDSHIKIWNLETKTEEFILRGHFMGITSLALTSDNQYIISGSMDSTVRIWSIPNRQQVSVLQGHTSPIYKIAVTPDMEHLASLSDKNLRIWSLKSKAQVANIDNFADYISDLRVTSDSKYFVHTSYLGTIHLWNTHEKRKETVLQGHTSKVHTIALTSDSKYIVTGSEDMTVRVWDLQMKRQEGVIDGHTRPVCIVTVSSANNYRVSVSEDEKITIWSLHLKRRSEGYTNFAPAYE